MDELDVEQYGDDFSESENFVSVSNDHHDDEQHAQRVNGQLENLEMLLDDLRCELNSEKLEHSKTINLLREASLTNEELSPSPPTDQDSDSEFEEGEKQHSSQPHNFSTPKIGCAARNQKENYDAPDIPLSLRTEMANFIKFLSTKSIPIGKIQSFDECDESYCISALRLIKKGISSYVKKCSESERGVGAPPNEIIAVGLDGKNDTKALKSKMLAMMQKMRAEKESGQRHMEELQLIKKNLILKNDHIERLMNHLKIEATSKLKIIEHLRVSEKSNRKLIERNSAAAKDSAAKDHLILELREGNKVLENQLCLMDEKQIDLRSKLDFSRELGAKRVLKADKIARDLRLKLAQMGVGGYIPDKMGSALPDIFTPACTPDGAPSVPDFYEITGEKNERTAHSNHISTVNTGNASSKTSRKSSLFKTKNALLGDKYEGHHGAGAVRDVSMEDVLEKIRRNRGDRQVWTQQKIRELVKSR